MTVTQFEEALQCGLKIVVYLPSEVPFRIHCKNWYAKQALLSARPDAIPNVNQWLEYCTGVLEAVCHLINYKAYRVKGCVTWADHPSADPEDAYGAVASVILSHHVPSWLLSICIEFARPMASSLAYYVPYLSAHERTVKPRAFTVYADALSPEPHYAADGLLAESMFWQLQRWQSSGHLKFDFVPLARAIEPAARAVAPLCVTDGRYTFTPAFGAITPQRKSAWIALQHLRNGYMKHDLCETSAVNFMFGQAPQEMYKANAHTSPQHSHTLHRASEGIEVTSALPQPAMRQGVPAHGKKRHPGVCWVYGQTMLIQAREAKYAEWMKTGKVPQSEAEGMPACIDEVVCSRGLDRLLKAFPTTAF